jgi:hypothetical protein
MPASVTKNVGIPFARARVSISMRACALSPLTTIFVSLGEKELYFLHNSSSKSQS